jgi:hypothetical protein
VVDERGGCVEFEWIHKWFLFVEGRVRDIVCLAVFNFGVKDAEDFSVYGFVSGRP